MTFFSSILPGFSSPVFVNHDLGSARQTIIPGANTFASIGGTIYSVSVSESVTASDTKTAIVNFVATRTETATATDTIVSGTIGVTVHETLTATTTQITFSGMVVSEPLSAFEIQRFGMTLTAAETGAATATTNVTINTAHSEGGTATTVQDLTFLKSVSEVGNATATITEIFHYHVFRFEVLFSAIFTTHTKVSTTHSETGSAADSQTVVITATVAEHGNAVDSLPTTVIKARVTESLLFRTKDLIFALVLNRLERNELLTAFTTQDYTLLAIRNEALTASAHQTANVNFVSERNEILTATAIATAIKTTGNVVNEVSGAFSSQTAIFDYLLNVNEHGLAYSIQSDLPTGVVHEFGSAFVITTVSVTADRHENGDAFATATAQYDVTITETGHAFFTTTTNLGTQVDEHGVATATINVIFRVPQAYAFSIDEDGLAQDTTIRPVISAKRLTTTASFVPVPEQMGSWYPWLSIAAKSINNILSGHQNVSQRTITVNPDSAATVFLDSRISVSSYLSITPISLTASQDRPWFSDQTTGAVQINHTSDPATDRTYRIVILG